MTTTGPNYPGTVGAEARAFGTVISGASNVSANDGVYAVSSPNGGWVINYFLAYNLGFSIPTGSTIVGITVEVEARRGGSGTIIDDTVRLMKVQPTNVGSNKATSTNLPTSDTIRTYGGAADLWGTTWTAAEINASTFGVRVGYTNSGGTTEDFYADFIRVSVTYTAGNKIVSETVQVVESIRRLLTMRRTRAEVVQVSETIKRVLAAPLKRVLPASVVQISETIVRKFTKPKLVADTANVVENIRAVTTTLAPGLSTYSVKPVVSVHSPYWPFHRIATFTTVDNLNFGEQLMQVSRCKFTISKDDYAALPDYITRGNLIAIESAVTRPMVYFMTPIEENLSSSIVSIEGFDFYELLNAKPTRQLSRFQAAAGQVFSQLIRAMNARGHTGLFMPGRVVPGPRVDIDVSGKQTLEALNDLAQRSNYEYGIDYEVKPSGIVATIDFVYRRGHDKSNSIVLYEGTNIVDVNRIQDTRGLRQSVTIYGGAGPLSQRTALTRAASGAPQAQDLGTAVETASELYRRTLDVPPMLRSSTILYRNSSDRTELSYDAARALEYPIGIAERYRLIINDTIDWAQIVIGDYVRIVVSSLALGPLDRVVRVTGMQPDPLKGQCVLTVEVPLG